MYMCVGGVNIVNSAWEMRVYALHAWKYCSLWGIVACMVYVCLT